MDENKQSKENAQEVQEQVQEQIQEQQVAPIQPSQFASWLVWLKEWWTDCLRVLRTTKKPDKEEFKTIVKVSGIGILLIGAIGFLVHLLNEGIKAFL